MAQDPSTLPSVAPHLHHAHAQDMINGPLSGTAAVRVEVGNTWARISPGEVSEHFTDDLTVTTACFTTGGKHGYRVCRKLEQLFHVEHGAVLVRAGLVPLVVEQLRAKGLQVDVERRYVLDPRAAPDLQVLGGVSGDDVNFLTTLASEPRGLVETCSGADMVQRLALMYRLFPRARIMIATNGSRTMQRQLRRDLERAGAGKVHRLSTYRWPWQGGRLLCHLGQFAASTRATDPDFDIVVVPNAIQAIAPAYHEALMSLGKHRVYGFMPEQQQLSRRSRLELQALIGPLLWRSPMRAAAPATVYWCQPPWAPRLGNVSALERKRRAVWHNDARNALVAEIARAVRAGDAAALWQHGLFLEQGTEMERLGSRKLDVTVLVETAEHGRELHRRLPDWTLRDGVPLAPGQIVEFSWADWHDESTIRTYLLAHQLGGVHAGVLVWAGPESPALLPRLARDGRGVDRVFLIDFADDFDEQARAATRRRLRSYEASGWPSVGVPRWLLHDEDQPGQLRGVARGPDHAHGHDGQHGAGRRQVHRPEHYGVSQHGTR